MSENNVRRVECAEGLGRLREVPEFFYDAELGG